MHVNQITFQGKKTNRDELRSRIVESEKLDDIWQRVRSRLMV